jgi:hypothetical protein
MSISPVSMVQGNPVEIDRTSFEDRRIQEVALSAIAASSEPSDVNLDDLGPLLPSAAVLDFIESTEAASCVSEQEATSSSSSERSSSSLEGGARALNILAMPSIERSHQNPSQASSIDPMSLPFCL